MGNRSMKRLFTLQNKEGIAGATALKGFMGFGCKSHIHTAKLLRLSEDLPIVIEIVDSEEKINKFLPHMDSMVKEGLITLEKANVIIVQFFFNETKLKNFESHWFCDFSSIFSCFPKFSA